MKYWHLQLAFAVLFIVSVSACKTASYQPKGYAYKGYRIVQGAAQDAAMQQLLQPYSDSVNRSMNAVVGVAAVTLEKKQPEGSLGDMMADAVLQTARAAYGAKVDIATLNSGGIRVQQIPAGNITRGKIFELMPFDNMIVVQQLSGKLLQQLLDHIAGRGGWPVAGMTMQIKDKKAVNISINGAPLDELATYAVALPDYVANGGDDCAMLRNITQENKGILIRDAILDYIKRIKDSGQTIGAAALNRVTNVE
jgi:2',3'-cyclic-nucleotide 2'-phosphodiesterase (5'-nucleotidase family)